MSQEQLLLELFNGLLQLQKDTNEILASASQKEDSWDVWTKYHIPNFLQSIAILVGIFVVVWQVNKQHKSNVEVQNEKLRCDLRLQLREEINRHIDKLNALTVSASGFPNALKISILVAKSDAEFGKVSKPLPQRVPAFNRVNYDIGGVAIELIKTIERYELVVPQLKIFQLALNVFLHDFNAVSSEYMRVLLTFLPFDASDEDRLRTGVSVYNRPLPEQRQLIEIQLIGDKYAEVLYNLGSWIYDLNIEIQNLALGHLFKKDKLPSRNPIDPNCIVIKTDKESMEKLTSYFENETDWGKSKIEAEKSAKEAAFKK